MERGCVCAAVVFETSSRWTRRPAFFFLFETKRGQDGIGWSHISRDLGIGEIATQGRPKQSGEKCATVSSSSSGVCYLLLVLQTCVAMSCWGRNNYAKRRESRPDPTVQTLPVPRLVPTSPNDQGDGNFIILSYRQCHPGHRPDVPSTHWPCEIDAHHVHQIAKAMT